MTRADAQKEAVRRWGPYAKVVRNPSMGMVGVKNIRFESRYGRMRKVIVAAGMGRTWEEAFADYDSRNNKEPR